MNNKKNQENSHKEFKKIIEEVKVLGYKPNLLLHSCCAPCGSYPIAMLTEFFDLTVYYGNSNIYPKEEFIKRYEETERYIQKLNKENKANIKIIKPKYTNVQYNEILSKYKDEKEGGLRCNTCYSLRFKELAKYAEDNDFEYICSAMTISRHKKEQTINSIIKGYAKKHNLKPLVSNFKKEKGLEKSQQIAKENNMYHQDYCGCKFSLRKTKL